MEIIIIVIVGLIILIKKIMSMSTLKHKLSNFVKYCDLYGYSFYGFYDSIGLEYRKILSDYEIINLFKDWKINPIVFPKNSKVVEHLVTVNFPFYEKRYSPIVEKHGGIRLFHFFSVFIKEKEGFICLSYEKRFIEDFKGKYFNHIRYMTGNAIDTYVKWSSKEALLELVKDAKYWNGGEKIVDKYKELIKLFITAHSKFVVCNETPCKVNLEDHTDKNHITIILSQEYENNNIDKKIILTMLKREGSSYFQVDKSFKGDENQNIIFYSFNNECIKAKIKQENQYDDNFMRDLKLPTTRLLTQAEIMDAVWEYSISSISHSKNSRNTEVESLLISLNEFEKVNGIVEVGYITNNSNGDYFNICACTNSNNHKLYIGFSSYLEKLSYDKITKIKDKLYIRCDSYRCYFLCTKESEERCRTDLDEESQMCHYLEYGDMLSILKELNVEGKVGDYTFTNEKEFKKLQL